MKYMMPIFRISTVMLVLTALSPSAFAADIVVNNAIDYENRDAIGGQAADASNVTNNSVTMITGGQVGTFNAPPSSDGRDIMGGASTGSGDVYGNAVTISDGRVVMTENAARVRIGGRAIGGYGGAGFTGVVRNNSVTVSGGQVDSEVVGGFSNGTDVRNNLVKISGSAVIGSVDGKGDVTGGWSGQANATSNEVTVLGGTIKGTVSGGISNGGQATNNTVTMTGGTVGGEVYGGFVGSGTGNADHNTVNMAGGSAAQFVYGGFNFGTGNATYNTVNMTDGTVGGDIAGGYSNLGDATNNTVTMADGRLGGDIYGGFVGSGTGNAANNTVTMTDGTVDGYIYGGYSNAGQATNNTVNMDGGDATLGIYGGFNIGTGNATYNTVNMTGGTVDWEITGGFSNGGQATDNTVNMTDGTVNLNLYGGYSNAGQATNNTVNMDGGDATLGIYGGFNIGTDNATYNTVNMTGGTVGGEISGGYSNAGQATNNTVNMAGGTAGGDIYGGFVGSGTGNADHNTVNMAGGTAGGDIYGGFVGSGTGNADHNTVNMAGGSAAQFVYGGFNFGTGNATYNTVNMSGGAVAWELVGGYSLFGNAVNNTVTMAGGRLGGDIYGGYSDSSQATNNTVNLHGGTIAGGVYGGGTWTGSDIRTGNTLNVHGFQGSLAEVNNFTHYSFLLPASLKSDDTLIHITGVIPTNLAGTTASLSMAGTSTALVPGATVVLIDKAVNKPDTTKVTVTQGISLIYDFTLSVDDRNRFIATLKKNAQVNPQTKALSEGRLAGLGLLNQGGDLFITTGLHNARVATEREERFHAFGAASGASLRYNSGSHVDVDSFSMLTGGAMRRDNLLLGAFFEAGWGDYNTYNSFANAAPVQGDGNTSYYGAGVFTRYDWNVSEANRLYADASLRVGRVKTDFSSNNLVNATGQSANYDLSSQYYGLHLGLGDEWNISETLLLDLSARYLWTRQKGQTAFVLGDPFEFKDTDSHRLRTGARLNYTAPGSSFTPYVGAYYEHEFSAKAKASVHGLNIDTPDLKGGTGIAELGLSFRPTEASNFSVNLGVQGYAGKREGVSGDIGLKWEF